MSKNEGLIGERRTDQFRVRPLSEKLGGINDLGELSKSIAQFAFQEFNADIVTFYEYYAEEDLLVIPPVFEGEIYHDQILKNKVTDKNAVLHKLVKENRPFFAENANEDWMNSGYITPARNSDQNNFINREKVKSSVGIPLIYKEDAIGLIFLSYRKRKEFNYAFKSKLTDFISEAAYSVYSTRLLKDNKEDSDKSLWSKFNTALKSDEPFTMSDLLDLIYSEIQRDFEVSNFYAALYQKIDDAIEFTKIINPQSAEVDDIQGTFHPRSAKNGLTEYVIRNKETLYLKEGFDKPLIDNFGREYGEIGPYSKCWLGVPLNMRDEVLGMLCIQDYKKSKIFTTHQINRFEEIARESAVLVHILQSLKDLKTRNLETAEFHKVTRLINTIHKTYPTTIDSDTLINNNYFIANRNDALKVILDRTSKLLGAGGAKIYYKDPSKNEIELIYSKGLDNNEYPKGKRLKLGEGLAGIVMQDLKPRIEEKYEDFNGRLEEYSNLFGSVICTPIMAGELGIGTLAVFDQEKKGKFSKSDLSLLTRFSNLVALVLQYWERVNMVSNEFYTSNLPKDKTSEVKLLLMTSLDHLNKSIENINKGNFEESDNELIMFKALLPQLFEKREVSSSFRLLVNSIAISLANQNDDLISLVQLKFLHACVKEISDNIDLDYDRTLDIIDEFVDYDLNPFNTEINQLYTD